MHYKVSLFCTCLPTRCLLCACWLCVWLPTGCLLCVRLLCVHLLCACLLCVCLPTRCLLCTRCLFRPFLLLIWSREFSLAGGEEVNNGKGKSCSCCLFGCAPFSRYWLQFIFTINEIIGQLNFLREKKLRKKSRKISNFSIYPHFLMQWVRIFVTSFIKIKRDFLYVWPL